MADKEKKKTSSFKNFFSRGKKEKKPDEQVPPDERGGSGEMNPDFGYSENMKKAVGGLSVTKDIPAPVKKEAVERKPDDIPNSSQAMPYDHADFENDEGEVVSHIPAAPRFEPVKKSLWSDDQPVRDDPVVTIDEINDLSGLILPKSATFEVEELKIHARSKVFDLKSSGGIPAYRETALRGEGFRTISEAATAIEAESPKKSILTKLNPLSAIHHQVEEYDRKIHGPLVDLTFRPRPGVEEIELYPVNEPYGFIRIS